MTFCHISAITDHNYTLKGGHLDFSHLTNFKNLYITEILYEKAIQIINN